MSHVVLVEATWVLTSVYGLDPASRATADHMLLNHRDLTVQDADIVSAALAQFRTRPSVSFSDCLVLEAARKAGHLRLGTFDRHRARLDDTQRL